MSIIDHIAVAIDFSAESEVALRAALKLADLAKSPRLTIVHAVRAVVMPDAAQPAVRAQLEALQAKVARGANEAIDALLAQHPSERRIERAVVAGRPADVVPATAKRIGATLLVLGTHARKGLRRLFMGSICDDTIRGSELPVLVMHVGGDGVTPDEELDRFDNAIIAIDLVEGCDKVAAIGAEFARAIHPAGARASLVHVIDDHLVLQSASYFGEGDDAYLRSAEGAAVTHLAGLKARLEGEGLEISTEVVHGHPAEALLDAAQRQQAEAIVVGTHGSGLAPILDLGHTAQQIIRTSSVLVLVVPSASGR